MIDNPSLPLFDLAICISDACDLVCSALVNHHKQVAWISYCIGKELKLEENRLKDLVLAAIMHDVGALSLGERIELMNFEEKNTQNHADIGYNLLRYFQPLERAAEIVRMHHCNWDDGDDNNGSSPTALESYIIHIADSIALSIDLNETILDQCNTITADISRKRGEMFHPETYSAFMELSQRESFWLDTVSPSIYRTLRRHLRMNTLLLDDSQLSEISILFSRIIDFRSKFTATHSAGVASVARELSLLVGFSKIEAEHMHIAGLLHDLGKLAIPREILEKSGELDAREFNLIRTHTYHTFRILDTLDDFNVINTWASLHHEKLNGKGYPFRRTEETLSLGSRIMCVADIYTALTEERAYRSGMNPKEASNVITAMAQHGLIDAGIVNILKTNYDSINHVRITAQHESRKWYDKMLGDCESGK